MSPFDDKRGYLVKLNKMFHPQSVAVVGASENPGKLGFHVMKSLMRGGFCGRTFPINPKASSIWNLPAYASIRDIPDEIDLAVIVVPAQAVTPVLKDCHNKGVQGVVLISAGFSEIPDPMGAALQAQIRQLADQWTLPIIGPNTFGFVNLRGTVNASFTPEFSRMPTGGVSLVSQSGGFCHLAGFRAIAENVGFSKVIGLGNRCNMDFADMVSYLADDPETNVMALYIEGMEEPRRLVEVARTLDGNKPILAYKAGRGPSADSASKFHTGSLAGRFEIYQGAFRQGGILDVADSEELLDTAKAVDCLAPLTGNTIAVLSSQAGPGMIACDACYLHSLQLAMFSSTTQERINQLLPALAVRDNPVDMGPAWYNPDAIMGIMEAVIDDPNVAGVLFLAMYASANVALAGRMREYFEQRQPLKKPMIACFSAPPPIWAADQEAMDRRKGLVFLPTPERTARAMGNLWRLHNVLA